MFVGVTISAFPAAKPHTVTLGKVDHGSMVAQYSYSLGNSVIAEQTRAPALHLQNPSEERGGKAESVTGAPA